LSFCFPLRMTSGGRIISFISVVNMLPSILDNFLKMTSSLRMDRV
jgi:hypothetical protein